MKRPLLLPWVPLYRAGLAWKNARLDRGLGVRRLRWPVVSVGSLSAGGAGKTPVVLALAQLLRDAGFGVDVLTRGYGRSGRGVERVEARGQAARYGDEAMLLAQAVDVFVGAERFAAGVLAESFAGGARRIHLLDDGFQHRRLARAMDVVLLTVADVKDCLLPAGNLREPLSALRRADAVVVRAEEAAALRPVLARIFAGVVWVVRRRMDVRGASRRPFVFCGIARPEDFLAKVRQHCAVAGEMVFRDHHAYGDRDGDRLIEAARAAGADGWVLTTKDAVKLSAAMRERMRTVGPVCVAELVVEFEDVSGVAGEIRRVLGHAGLG